MPENVTEERRELAVHNDSSEFVESGSLSLSAEPSLPPSSTNTGRPKAQRPVREPRDFSQVQQPSPLHCLSRTLVSARKIDDLDSVTYPEGIKTPVELNQGQTGSGNYRYDRDLLLRFMQVCKDKPGNFSKLDGRGIARGTEDHGGLSLKSVGRSQRNRMGSMGAPPGVSPASGSIGLGLPGFPGGTGSAPFVMGNFSSTPSRMTSEERFASTIQDKTVTGSVTIRGGAVSLSRSSDQGGAGGPSAVSSSPSEQPRTRAQRGRTRNSSLKPDALQPSEHEQQQQQAPSGPEQALPVYYPEDRWTPTARRKFVIDENSPEYVERKVRALLNKLTLENFESVSNQIISWANKSENENNAATMALVIKIIFEKAIDEELRSETYARLCVKVVEQISPNSQKESAQSAAALKDADDISTEDASKANRENGRPVLYSDEYYTLCKIRRQGLGLVRFIGELFKLHLFTERIIHDFLKKLLSKIDNLGEEIESMCNLLTAVGEALDKPRAKDQMDTYFMKVQMLANNPNIGWRIRHKLLDVIELRQRNWIPRNPAAGPSTITQFFELLIPVKALLHKLSLKNFDSVSSQIISWANKSENEKNGATLILITKLVFEKATDEAHRHQGLGLVRFIGELFKLQMLTERIMHECIKKLLSKIENPEEEEIESLCKLLTTVGQALDTPKANGHMDIHFSKIQMLADNPNVASRIRNMLLDVIELRQRNWRPKNAAAGLSTIAQARGQGAKKAAKKAAAATQQASKIVPITRGGAQRGGLGQPVQGPDGWNVAGPTPVRAPVKPGDLSNFGKLTASTGPLKTTGPSSTSKKGDRGHNTPSPGSSGSLSRAASGSNIYSLLGAGGADADTMPKRTPRERGTTGKPSADQAPQQAPNTPLHKKLNLSPRAVSSVNTTEDSYGDKNKLESHKKRAAGATKSYTKQELKAKVEEDVKEFFNIRDVREGEKRFAELPDEHKSRLVDKLASKALELQESDVKLVAELFERVASKGCPPSAFEDGLAVIIEFLDDMVIDVPQVYAFMARLLRGARLPQETVDSLGDKIFVDGNPLVKPKDKLLKAYNSIA
ncbi:hypothetical protein FRC00_006638 [Tulasnella sp. 408]|nr:hypothetical protein FRC00_006638 [Tulasnella sp. 408]